jgi:hypothetical protein
MHSILLHKPEGQTPLGKLRHSHEYNNKMDHQERGWEGVDWIHLAKDKNK